MYRKVLALAAVLTAALLVVGSGRIQSQEAGDKQVVLKGTLAYDSAKVTIDGVATRGKGLSRNLSAVVPAGKDYVNVKVVWEPNNYTTITRTRKVPVKGR